ncbi:helix-turn-helix domain-containing protein [Streptomyces sp. NPDC101178]|uniref:XRE family transcriptional regulator n=1 Tax=Streptomyces sp. NPDC101178 TaxID=3366124 RepID=UPI00382EAC9B
MPRWRALPEELDPQIREFTSQLRRIVDRSGLNTTAVADRTGFSKTSWERYLNGRLLPPRRAVVALADVTGTQQHHLTTMWELAERAWSRAEMRHDMTIEAIRVSQAREALGASDAADGGRNGAGRSAGGRHSASGSASAGRGATATGTADAHGPDTGRPDTARPDGHGPDAYGPDAYGPGAYGRDAHNPDAHGPDAYGSGAYGPDPYGFDAYDSDLHRADGRAPSVPTQRGTVPPVPPQRQAGRPANGARGGGVSTSGRSRVIMLAVGAAGAVIVVVGALMLAPSGDEPAEAAPPTPTSQAPTAAPTSQAPDPATEEPAPAPPAGVECQGDDCTGQNPDEMGCGGEYARTVTTTGIGASRVEVRYSEVCSAAWARLTEAGPGDTVTITGSAAADGQNGEVTVTEAYTPMVAVRTAADAKACATLTSGTKGCTT